MKTLTALMLSASLLAFGCGDDDGGASSADANNPTADATAGNPDATVTPQMPALAATQIDRIGRPAISTALQATFDGNATTRNAAKDAYNQDANVAGWSTYAGAPPASAGTGTPGSGFVGSLGILDGLDGTCGNQLAYDLAGASTGYAGLAGVLADDRLYVNTEPDISGGTPCAVGYLAVEANATAIIPNDDCGGRTLVNDVIDRSYSVLAIGALSGVSDGVDANDVAFRTSFPYLADPQ